MFAVLSVYSAKYARAINLAAYVNVNKPTKPCTCARMSRRQAFPFFLTILFDVVVRLAAVRQVDRVADVTRFNIT